MSSLKRNTRNKKETLMRKAEKPFCFIRVKADFKKKMVPPHVLSVSSQK